jgi:hypothetical protein
MALGTFWVPFPTVPGRLAYCAPTALGVGGPCRFDAGGGGDRWDEERSAFAAFGQEDSY